MLYYHHDRTDNQTTIKPEPGESEPQAAQRIARQHAHGLLTWGPPETDDERQARVTARARVDDGTYYIADTD